MAIGGNPATASRATDGKNVNVTRRRRRGSLTCGISKRTTIMLVDYTRKQANLSPNSLSRLNSLVEGDIRRRPQDEDLEESKHNDDLPVVGSQTEFASFEDSISSTSSHLLSNSNKQCATNQPPAYRAQRRLSTGSLSNSNQNSLSSSEHSLGLEKVFEEKITAASQAKQALYCISVSISEGGEKIKFSLRNPEMLKAIRNAFNESREKLSAVGENGHQQSQPKPASKLKREIKCHVPHDRFKLPQIKAISADAGHQSRRFSNAGTVMSTASTTNILQCIEEEESDNIMAEMSQNRVNKKLSLMDSCDSFAIDTLSSDDESVEEDKKHPTLHEVENESDTETGDAEEQQEKKEESSHGLSQPDQGTVAGEESPLGETNEMEKETEGTQPKEEAAAAAGAKVESAAKADHNVLPCDASVRSSHHQATRRGSLQFSTLTNDAAFARSCHKTTRRGSLAGCDAAGVRSSHHATRRASLTGDGSFAYSSHHATRRGSLHASTLADSGSFIYEDGVRVQKPPKFGTSMPSLMFMGGDYGTSELDICPSQQDLDSSTGLGASASESTLFGGEDSLTNYDSRSEIGDSQSTAYGDGSQSQFGGSQSQFDGSQSQISETDAAYDADNTEVGAWNEDATEVALVDDSLIGHGYRRSALPESDSEDEYEEDLFNEEDGPEDTEAGEVESQASTSAAEQSETDGSLVTTATDESSQAGLNYGLSQYLSTHSRSVNSGYSKHKSCNDSQTVTSITASMTTGYQSMDASGQSSVRSRSARTARSFHSQRTSKSAPTMMLRQDSATSLGSSRGELDDTGHDSLRFDEFSKASSAPLDSSSRRKHGGHGSSRHHSHLLNSSYGKMLNGSHSGHTSGSALDHSDADSSVASSADKRRKRRSSRHNITMLGDSSSVINRSFRASKKTPDGKIPRSNTPQGVLLRSRSGDGLPHHRSSMRQSVNSRSSTRSDPRSGLPSRTKSMDGSIMGSRRGSSSRHRSSQVSISSQGTERSRGVNRTKSRESFMGGSRIKKWGGSTANKSGHGLSLLEQHLTKGAQQSRRSRRQSISDPKKQNSDIGSLPSMARSLRS